MRNTIAIMNTKGGVGKSTLVLAMAETLSAKFGKNVLVIDFDAQASVSLMLLSTGNLYRLQVEGLTIVDLLVASVLKNEPVDWTRFVVAGVSDVEESRSVYLIPSDMQLTLFEREVTKEGQLVQLRASVGALLGYVRAMFDIILIDCPPGLSVLTDLGSEKRISTSRRSSPTTYRSMRLRCLAISGGSTPSWASPKISACSSI